MDAYGQLLRHVLFPAFEMARGRPTISLLRSLERSQWASADELNELQSKFLVRLMRHAYQHTAYYRKVLVDRGLTPDDISSPAELNKLPLLEKSDARGSMESRLASAPPFPVIHKATSGSTGEPLRVSYNAESRHYRDATRIRGYGWAGYHMGNRALHYWGVGAVPTKALWDRKKRDLDHFLKRDTFIDCTPRSDAHLSAVVAAIKQRKPEVIVTYSQAGATLARYIVRTGCRDWGTIPVVCGAERVYAHDRDTLTAAFGPAVFETYGSREVMLMASECEVHDGLHTSMETMIVELVVREADGSVRTAEPGETGEVVVTDLHNLSQPLIRYVNGDLAVQRAADRCPCGRTLTRIGPIEGRVSETLRDANGDPVNGLVMSILFVDLAEQARQFQTIQHADNSLTLKIVPAEPGPLPASTSELIDMHCAKYLPGIPVTIDLVDDIPAGPAGKHQIVIVEPPA